MAIIWTKMPNRVYQFSGGDADAFLQGQITQDVKLIQQGICHYGAYCTHKGKMLANFLLSRNLHNDLLVRLHETQAESVMKRLQMFVLRSDVKVELLPLDCFAGNEAMANEVCQQYGLPLPSLFNCESNDDVTVYALPSGYYEVTLAADSTFPLSEELNDRDAVESLRLRGGHFNILPETSEMILPQQTPLADWQGINYKKGCYIGQEIIARNKYLGVVKKGFAVAVTELPVDCPPASAVKRDNRAVGQVIESYRGELQSVCAAILSLESLEQTCHVAEEVPAVFNSIVDNHQE